MPGTYKQGNDEFVLEKIIFSLIIGLRGIDGAYLLNRFALFRVERCISLFWPSIPLGGFFFILYPANFLPDRAL